MKALQVPTLYPAIDPPPSTDKVSVPEKFAKFISLVKVLFAVPTFDAVGDVIDLNPATLSQDLKDSLETSSSVKDLSRSIINIITHLLTSGVKQSRDFIFKTFDPPLINHALISTAEYSVYLRATSDNVAYLALDQSEYKMAVVQRKTYVGGRQETLSNVISTLENFLAFIKGLVEFNITHTS